MYVYTPVFVDGDGMISPGKGDPVVLAVADVGPNCKTLKYDVDTRFVLRVQDDTALQAGWAEKTQAEVNTDYPGLIP